MATAGRLDRVELKVVLPARYRARLQAALNPRHVQHRRIRYYDTCSRRLFRNGLVLRSRHTARDAGDLTLKLRLPRPPSEWELARLRDLPVELDALPRSALWSTSIARAYPWPPHRIAERHLGRLLCDADQSAILDWALGGIPSSLHTVGPITATRYSGGPLSLEFWHFPNGLDALELSAKCKPSRAVRRADQMRQLLRDLDITVPTSQTTKTALAVYATERRTGRWSEWDLC
jgi:hypothetical protein